MMARSGRIGLIGGSSTALAAAGLPGQMASTRGTWTKGVGLVLGALSEF